MKLRIIRALLWIVRALGCDLVVDGRLIYQWVQTPDGRFDHWIASPTRQYEISETLEACGFKKFAWDILVNTGIILGSSRRIYNNVQSTLGIMYACHGKRELLSDGTFRSVSAGSVASCEWVLKSIRLFDQADVLCKNREMTATCVNLRVASLHLVARLSQTDLRLAQLLHEYFPAASPTQNVSNAARN
jgi:hypothetical protein